MITTGEKRLQKEKKGHAQVETEGCWKETKKEK